MWSLMLLWSDSGWGSSQREPALGEGQEPFLPPMAGSGHCFGWHRSPCLLPAWGRRPKREYPEKREHPKGWQKLPGFPPPRLGWHGCFPPLRLGTLGQPGSSVGGQHARAWRLGGLGCRGHLWRLTAHEISGSSQHTGRWDPWQLAGWGWWAPKGCLHHGAQVRAQTFPSQGSPRDARLALQADGVVLEWLSRGPGLQLLQRHPSG